MGRARNHRAQPTSKTGERVSKLLNLGAELLEQGRAEEAIPYLEHAHSLDANNIPSLINLGGAYVLAGHPQQAIPLLERARDAEPQNAMVWINLGAAYLGNPVLATAEQQLQAIVAFQTALELNPAAPSVHYNLGLIFVDRHETDLAIAAFRQALQSNPLDRDFRQALQSNPLDRDAQLWLSRLDAGDELPRHEAECR
jgi:tetratricopeptide (TPR) repeat protein